MASKTFFIRMDKMGDVISTLPVDEAPFLQKEGHEVHWVLQPSLRPLVEAAEKDRAVHYWSSEFSWERFSEFRHFLTNEKPDSVVIFQAPWWVSAACWLSGIHLRSGRKSQWHSFIFLNDGLRQSRSQSEFHEFEYNWDLLHHAFAQEPPPASMLPIFKLRKRLDRQLFEKWNLRSKSYVAVHPGMAGSALNWPATKYNELISALVPSTTVVITGTKQDTVWLKDIAPLWEKHENIRYLVGQLQLEELVFILQSAKVVVAPSTGIAHLATATGTPVVAIYPPILSQHPRRWGPRGANAQILIPEVQCPSQRYCLKEKCPHFYCMDSVKVEKVLQLIGFP